MSTILQSWTNTNPITGEISFFSHFFPVQDDHIAKLQPCQRLGCNHGVLLHTNDDLRRCKVFGCKCRQYKRISNLVHIYDQLTKI